MSFGLDLFDDDDDSLELTSMIDVVFLLLTFFILAATFVAPSLDVVLAKAENAASVSNKVERVTFSINNRGAVFHEKNEIKIEDVAHILEGKPSDTSIVFNVDEKAPFDAFIGVMDKVKGCGFNNFLINAQLAHKPAD